MDGEFLNELTMTKAQGGWAWPKVHSGHLLSSCCKPRGCMGWSQTQLPSTSGVSQPVGPHLVLGNQRNDFVASDFVVSKPVCVQPLWSVLVSRTGHPGCGFGLPGRRTLDKSPSLAGDGREASGTRACAGSEFNGGRELMPKWSGRKAFG